MWVKNLLTGSWDTNQGGAQWGFTATISQALQHPIATGFEMHPLMLFKITMQKIRYLFRASCFAGQ